MPANYKKGVFHVHSSFSDGSGRIAEICREARESGLDFIVLTDHGRPNLEASAATGCYHGILLIGASEFSLNEGHLAAAGYRVPAYIFPPEAQEAISEVDRDHGVTFVSHPFDRKIPWSGWQVRDFTGIEIFSLYQLAKKASFLQAAVFPLQYAFHADYAFTKLLTVPEREMRLWDSLNRQGRYFAIYALDAHAKIEIGGKFQLDFPSYAAMFKILTIYVKVQDEPSSEPRLAAAAIIAAMRRGDFFNVIEALAPANGFENYYRENDGRRVEMGGDAESPGGALIFKLPFDFATDIVVKKDGIVFKTIRANTRRELSVPVARAGVYRCEISLATGRFKQLPWIMANPIRVATPAAEKKPAAPVSGTIMVKDGGFFLVEKNSRSSASLAWQVRAETPPVTGLTFVLQPEASGQRDFWVALAHRKPISGSGYHGFVFEARAGRAMRFWLQFRTGKNPEEAAYQHSFLATELWRQIAIPFSAFHRLYGQPALPDPAWIDSFFFLIDNGNASPGAGGEIFLRQIGLY